MGSNVRVCAGCGGRLIERGDPQPLWTCDTPRCPGNLARFVGPPATEPTRDQGAGGGLVEVLGGALCECGHRADLHGNVAWPGDDVFYDVRAWQKSGIPDPVALGLCNLEAHPLRPEYAA